MPSISEVSFGDEVICLGLGTNTYYQGIATDISNSGRLTMEGTRYSDVNLSRVLATGTFSMTNISISSIKKKQKKGLAAFLQKHNL